ncbi:MAG TPA: hypothetical protein VKB38_15660 [Terracidiphilus sp.]|nr:hypothetical protein [Terracidiphilus sp.]
MRGGFQAGSKKVQKNGPTAAFFALFEIDLSYLLSACYPFTSVFDLNILKGLREGGGGYAFFGWPEPLFWALVEGDFGA